MFQNFYKRTFRVGVCRVYQEANTILACLASVSPLLDRLYVGYHRGSNDDGSLDLIRQFVDSKSNGECEIIISFYDKEVVYINDPRYLRGEVGLENTFGKFSEWLSNQVDEDLNGKPHTWLVVDADHIYLTDVLERQIRLAEYYNAARVPVEIRRMGLDSIVYEGNIMMCKSGYRHGEHWDHTLVNSIVQYKYVGNIYTGADDRIRKILINEENSITRDGSIEDISWFHFRKGVWRGAPPKVKPEPNELDPFMPKLQVMFDMYARPLLEKFHSPYKDLDF